MTDFVGLPGRSGEPQGEPVSSGPEIDRREVGALSTLVFWLRSDDGQGLVEYALIIAIIAIAVIVAMLFLRDQITNVFSNIGNNLT
jgi:pilus assembly protein Flp/PilA